MYTDDILIIHSNQITQIQNILNEFNSIHTAPKYTTETERDKKLNLLDLTSINQENLIFTENLQPPTTLHIMIFVTHINIKQLVLNT